MDHVSLEIAIADGTFACNEINKASASNKDGGFSSAAARDGNRCVDVVVASESTNLRGSALEVAGGEE